MDPQRGWLPSPASPAWEALNLPLAPVEAALSRLVADLDDRARAVFIVGSPRSGTTLLYQLLVRRYRLAYFDNLTARLHRAPAVAMLVEDRVLGDVHPASYRSRAGKTPGRFGPHECGAFWYRWFPSGDHVHVPPGATPPDHLRALRREVLAMEAVKDRPVVFKNTYNSMRIAPILEALPEARFLVCRRDLVDVAQSLLKCRVRDHGDKETWWSVPPPEIDELRQAPYWEQVVGQAARIYEEIDRRRDGAEDRFLDVAYEDVCDDPRGVLEEIAAFLAGDAKPRNDVEVPPSFERSTGVQVDEEDHERIVETVHRYRQDPAATALKGEDS